MLGCVLELGFSNCRLSAEERQQKKEGIEGKEHLPYIPLLEICALLFQFVYKLRRSTTKFTERFLEYRWRSAETICFGYGCSNQAATSVQSETCDRVLDKGASSRWQWEGTRSKETSRLARQFVLFVQWQVIIKYSDIKNWKLKTTVHRTESICSIYSDRIRVGVSCHFPAN